MGLSLSWVAVKGHGPDAVMAAVGVEPGDGSRREQAYVGELPGGWTLYFDEHFERGFKGPLDRIVALGAPVIAARQEDHVMYSEARGYNQGRELWRVARDPDEMPETELVVTGAPPEPFEDIRAKRVAEQAVEDAGDGEVSYVYDIPLDLAFALCGYRADDADEGDLTPVRQPASPRAGGVSGFFKWLFSNRY